MRHLRIGNENRAIALLPLFVVGALGILFTSEAWAGPSSFVIGVQDRRLNIAGVDDPAGGDFPAVDNEQTSVRSTWTWRTTEKLTVVAQTGWAKSFLELNDTELTGMTDGRLRLLYRPAPAWVLGVGTIIPFGLYELTANEVTAAQWTWNPRSGFPLSSFGAGLGYELTLARAFDLSDNVSAGFAGAFLKHAEFDLLAGGTGKYQLGDEFGLSSALDIRFARGRMLRLDFAYVLFGTDQLGGADFVDQGDQIQLGAQLHLPAGAFTTTWAVRGVTKGDNTLFQTDDADSLVEIAQASGSYLYFDGRVAYAFTRNFLFHVFGRITASDESEYAIGANGTSFQFGPGIGWRIGRSASVGLQYGYIDGHGDGDVSFDGSDILFTLELRSQ